MFPDKRGSSELVEMSWGRQCTERVQQVPFLPWGAELGALSPKPPTAAFGFSIWVARQGKEVPARPRQSLSEFCGVHSSGKGTATE